MNLEIKSIRSLFDLKRVHDIQRQTWGYRDLMVIPYTQLISAQHSGGTLLGAYVNGQLVGFVYGYLGMSGSSLYLFSQRMGVLPNMQSKGIGMALKLAQREQMLRQGIDLIIWTYDPLLGKNAMLNIEKLGGIVRTYVREIYGRVENPLQAGLATDRFLCEWHLLSDRVRERIHTPQKAVEPQVWIEEENQRLVNYANWVSDLPRPIAADLELNDPILLVQVPSNIQAIKRRDLAIARGWSTTTRQIFESYFKRGYVITGFASEKKLNTPNVYRLEKTSITSTVDFSSWISGIEDDEVEPETAPTQ